MPRTYHMSWEGEPYFRWVKMHKGVRYRVTCQELGAMVFTKEATAGLANAWWERKAGEVDGPPVRALEAVDRIPLGALKEMADRGEAAKKILSDLPFVQPSVDAPDLDRAVRLVAAPTAPPDATLRYHTARFLDLVRGNPKTFKEIRDALLALPDVPGWAADMDVRGVNEERVQSYFLWLKRSALSAVSKKKRWAIVKRLVRYLWENNLAALPRNLDSRLLRFTAGVQAVRTYSKKEVADCLSSLKPRLRLYALLGLNCGMTNVDVGRLRKEQVDLPRGRLVRKRVKTQHCGSVPTVDYPLWANTLQLLKEFWSAHEEYALTSARGTPLVESRLEGDEFKEKDLVGLMWQRARPPLPLKAFRSVSATLLESHEAYGRYKGHFLGHSPKSIADRHYAAPSAELFDRIVGWLYGELFDEGEEVVQP